VWGVRGFGVRARALERQPAGAKGWHFAGRGLGFRLVDHHWDDCWRPAPLCRYVLETGPCGETLDRNFHGSPWRAGVLWRADRGDPVHGGLPARQESPGVEVRRRDGPGHRTRVRDRTHWLSDERLLLWQRNKPPVGDSFSTRPRNARCGRASDATVRNA